MWCAVAPTAVLTSPARPTWRQPTWPLVATLLSAVTACVMAASPCDAQALEQGSSETHYVAPPPPSPPPAAALADPVPTITVRPLRLKDKDNAGAPAQNYCVRLCDGFYFPIAPGVSASEEKDLCAAMCPGAQTEPYRRAAGEATMDEATGPNRKPYKSLATAYSYRASMSPQCACRAAAGLPALALTQDPTLRSGDIVLTPKGVRIFAGASRPPFRESDFVDFRAKGRLPRSVLTYLTVIDKAFRFTPVTPAPKSERVSTAEETQQSLVKRR